LRRRRAPIDVRARKCSNVDRPNVLDSTLRATAAGAVETVDKVASPATEVLAKAANEALATSGNGVILDALADAATTMTAAAVAVDMLVGPANPDGLMAEVAITGDVVVESITDASAGEGDDMASVLTNDGVAADTFVTELTAAASDDLERPEAGAVTRGPMRSTKPVLWRHFGRAR